MNLYAVTQPAFLGLLAHMGIAEVPWYGNALIAIWLWCLGANVGSFMNVVVYRLPVGASVVSPRSRCPQCGHFIRWYDNLPVASWFLLRGRCRDCGLPIAARYPLVEALVAALFLVVAFLGPIAMLNDSGRLPPPPARGQTMLSLCLMYGLHMMLLCTLACASLMRSDGHVPPARLFGPAAAVGLAAPLAWPALRPVPVHALPGLAPWLGGMWDGLAGLAGGTALGLFVERASRVAEEERPDVASFAVTGIVLGWQAVCGIACLATAVQLLASVGGRLTGRAARLPIAAGLGLGTLVYAIGWGPLVTAAPWMGPRATMGTFSVAALAAGALAWMATRAAPAAAHRPIVPPTQNALPCKRGGSSVNEETRPDLQRILSSPSYRPAEADPEFLQRDELRPVRLLLELLKPELFLSQHGVRSTIVVFGGTQVVERGEAQRRLQAAQAELARCPDDARRQAQVRRAERILAKSRYYDAARQFGRLVSSACQDAKRCEFVIVTGGGPGIMEAANRGAHDAGAKSIGLNVALPAEQIPNPYITPELCFQFHYFAIRKMHFLLRAKALVVFPGGFGTLDELFDAVTLRQTRRMQEIPIILFGRQYWDRVIDFQFLVDEGVIAERHLNLISYAETPQEAWDIICRFHGVEQGPAGTGPTSSR